MVLWIAAALICAVLGTLWHFLYDWFPCALTALLCPVNESVWEHLKLLYFPPLACAVFLSLRVRCPQRSFWSGVLAGVLLSAALLTGSFYTLTAGFALPSDTAARASPARRKSMISAPGSAWAMASCSSSSMGCSSSMANISIISLLWQNDGHAAPLSRG